MNGSHSIKIQSSLKNATVVALLLIFFILALGWGQTSQRSRWSRRDARRSTPQVYVQLPQPESVGSITFERAMQKTTTIGPMSPIPLTGAAIGQLAWTAVSTLDSATMAEQWLAGQTLSEETLELYIITFEGLFRYHRNGHRLEQMAVGDLRTLLTQPPDGLSSPVNHGAALILVDSSLQKGSRRGVTVNRRNLLKVGQIAQALRLQAAGLGLISVPLEPLDEIQTRQIMDLPRNTTPLYVLLVGYPPNQTNTPMEARTPLPPTPSQPQAPVVLVVAPEDFQDQELQLTQQTLTNAGIQCVISSTRLGPVHGILGQTAYATLLLDRLKADQMRGIIFIGGPGATQLVQNQAAHQIALEVANQGKILGGFSTAVMILGQAGLLKQIRVTGHPSDQRTLIETGAIYTGNAVERDGLIFTAIGPASAQSLAQSVISALKSIP